MAEIGVAQGLPANGFQVLDHRGLQADGDNFCATTGTNRGDLVFFSAQGVVTRGTTGGGALIQWAGFIDTNVVSDMATRRLDVHGDYAQVNTDRVSVWREGRFRITNVVGVIGDNVIVYPGATGGISATQTGGTDRAVGICRKGNGGVSAGPIEVELDNFGG